MKDIITTCTCGEKITVTYGYDELFDANGYDICNLVCPKCGFMSTGGNTKTGEIYDWTSPKELAFANAEFEAQRFDADQNDFYGRGQW